MSYVYKRLEARLAVRVIDWVGYLFWRLPRRRHWPNFPLPSPKRICFLVLHQIGDLVMCLPALKATRELFPEAELSLIAGTVPAQLMTDNDWGITVYSFDANWQKVVKQLTDSNGRSATLTGLSELLKDISPEVILVFHPDFQVNRLLGKCADWRVFGFSNAGGGFWTSNPVKMPERGHQVERNFSLVRELAKTYSLAAPTVPALTLPLKKGKLEEIHAEVKEIVKVLAKDRKTLLPDWERLVVIHPCGSAVTKNWLPKYWQEVIKWLQEKKYSVAVIGSKQDRLPSTWPPVLNLCGELSLLQTAALLSKAKLLIGVDSGPGHLAAMVNCPIVSIFSSVNQPERWAPFAKAGKLEVLHAEPKDRKAYPLERRSFPADVTGNPYLEQIKPDKVIEVLAKYT